MAGSVRKTLITLLLVVVTAGLGRAQSVPTIRIAVPPSADSAEVSYAKELGIFARLGVNVDVQTMSVGPATAGAVAAGAVDIGFAAVASIAAAYSKHIPLAIVAPAALYESTAPNTALVTMASSTLRSAKDLDGKTIAASGLGTTSDYGFRQWMDKNGGDSTTIKIVELGFSSMPSALAAGRIDAAIMVEPFLSVAKKNGRVLAHPYDGIAKEFLVTAWFGSQQWTKDHPDLADRFGAAMREAALWANDKDNQARRSEILAQYTKIDAAVAAAMAPSRFAERLTPALLQPVIDVAAKYGKFTSFPAAELLYGGLR